MVQDEIILEDEDGKIIFNQKSFCELIKYILVELVGISYEEASILVDNSHLAAPVKSVTDVSLFNHEDTYFWAMELYYGNCYWMKGIAPQPEDQAVYMQLENKILKEHNLKEPFEW